MVLFHQVGDNYRTKQEAKYLKVWRGSGTRKQNNITAYQLSPLLCIDSTTYNGEQELIHRRCRGAFIHFINPGLFIQIQWRTREFTSQTKTNQISPAWPCTRKLDNSSAYVASQQLWKPNIDVTASESGSSLSELFIQHLIVRGYINVITTLLSNAEVPKKITLLSEYLLKFSPLKSTTNSHQLVNFQWHLLSKDIHLHQPLRSTIKE